MIPVTRQRLLTQRHAFSLLEILVVVAILSILTTVSYPFYADFHIRSQVLKVRMDMIRISDALQMYRADYCIYPDIYINMGGRHTIGRVYELHPYLKPVPHNPWTGKMSYVPWYDRNGKIYKMEMSKQFDYWIDTISLPNGMSDIPPPGWSINCGGPVSDSLSYAPYMWYSPTNGTLSFGGFWLDSMNRTNIR